MDTEDTVDTSDLLGKSIWRKKEARLKPEPRTQRSRVREHLVTHLTEHWDKD